jgi:hypothetical protein
MNEHFKYQLAESQLNNAKEDVKLFLVHPRMLDIVSSEMKAEYLFFLTRYQEAKHEIVSMEEQTALVKYLDPEFGVGHFARKIDEAQEEIKTCIRRLTRLVEGIKQHNGERLHGKLEEVE